jgi:hypothetical protein
MAMARTESLIGSSGKDQHDIETGGVRKRKQEIHK